jgi:arylformamidase
VHYSVPNNTQGDRMARRDPAWLDAQYNNRARIADSARIFERWSSASALVRERTSRRLDLRYGDGPNETLDVFPAARADAPVLVFIHGGYWRGFDKADHSFLAASFVADGAMVVVPNYALCPAVTVEDIALQMTRALAWTWRNAALYGGDPRRIVVAGHSAGGHLAAMLLCCDWKAVARDLPARLVSKALSLSGLFDLETLRKTPYLQGDLRLTPASAKRLSPALFPAPRGTLYAVVGADESEEDLRHNALIRQAWGPRTVSVCETLPGHHHLSILTDFADPQGRTHQLALQLLG